LLTSDINAVLLFLLVRIYWEFYTVYKTVMCYFRMEMVWSTLQQRRRRSWMASGLL